MKPTWPDLMINGDLYGLSHLQSFTVNVTPKAPDAPTFKVYVSFGYHTFTRTPEASDGALFRITHEGEERCFCHKRHGHSLHLPAIVRGCVNGKVYFSERQNYLIVENLPGVNGPYAVFFNVEKAKSRDFDAAMFVVSAYEKPDLPPLRRLDSITFPTLISKTSSGLQVKRPPKKY
jgi:hypothetical protein